MKRPFQWHHFFCKLTLYLLLHRSRDLCFGPWASVPRGIVGGTAVVPLHAVLENYFPDVTDPQSSLYSDYAL